MYPNYTPLDSNPGLSAQFSVNYDDGSVAEEAAIIPRNRDVPEPPYARQHGPHAAPWCEDPP